MHFKAYNSAKITKKNFNREFSSSQNSAMLVKRETPPIYSYSIHSL